MKQSDNLLTIIKELEEEAKHVDDEQIQGLIQAICEANRIFVVGVGRSGFVGRAFSNRLMHLGFTVYFIGEPTTPSIQEGDRSEEHTSELQSRGHLVCRLLLEKKK